MPIEFKVENYLAAMSLTQLIITLIHTSFSPKTTLQFFVSIGSHNNKKKQKFFLVDWFLWEGVKCVFSLKTRVEREGEQLLGSN